jgi:hypothetical protein
MHGQHNIKFYVQIFQTNIFLITANTVNNLLLSYKFLIALFAIALESNQSFPEVNLLHYICAVCAILSPNYIPKV